MIKCILDIGMIKALMNIQHMSLRKLKKATKLHPYTVERALSGFPIRVKSAKKIAHALSVNFDLIFMKFA